MSKIKQFFIPISLSQKFDEVNYLIDGKSDKYFKSHYPSMNMIMENVNEGDDYEIIALRTKDYSNKPGSNGYKSINQKSMDNYNILVDELKTESEKKHFKTPITVTKVIEISYDESQQKHIELFNNICSSYKDEADVFVDLTYGNKTTSAALMSSLVYAEKVKYCDICEVVYGEYSHDDKKGKVFDIRCLYELSMLVQTCSSIPGINIDKMLRMFGGDD